MSVRPTSPNSGDKMTQSSSRKAKVPSQGQSQSQSPKGSPKERNVAWSRHEHVSPPVQTQAQKLLQEAGSPELAHLAVDHAADESATVDVVQRAERWGYASRNALLASSVSLVSRQGRAWWATLIGDGKWIAWNERDNNTSGDLKTLDEAREFVAGADEKPQT